MKNRRWHCIDGMYAMGTILVILGHSHSSDWSSFYRTPLERMLLFIYMFHMPLFFCIAGFLFGNSDALDRKGYGNWLYRKALRLLTPYTVLTLMAVIPKYYADHHGLEDLTLQYILKGFLVPRANVWGHFWFLPVLLELYALFGWICTRTSAALEQSMWRILLLAAVILYFCPVSAAWLGIGDLCRAAVYFAVGGAVNSRIRQKGEFRYMNMGRFLQIAGGTAAALIPASVYILAPEEMSRDGLFFKLLALATALLMIWVCAGAGQLIGTRSWAVWISRHALSLYIFAWPFQYPLMLLCGRLQSGWLLTSILMFAAGLTVPALFIQLYEKARVLHHPFFDLVMGIRPAVQVERDGQ